MGNEPNRILRSDFTTALAKSDGVLQGLLLAAQTGQPISAKALSVAKETWNASLARLEVGGLEDWAAVDDNATLGDLLVMFSALRSVQYCFLSPEQFAELQSPPEFGLSAIAQRQAK